MVGLQGYEACMRPGQGYMKGRTLGSENHFSFQINDFISFT